MGVFTLEVGELNWTDLHQVDPVTRHVIGHARQRREVDWLQGCSARNSISVQFSHRLYNVVAFSDMDRQLNISWLNSYTN